MSPRLRHTALHLRQMLPLSPAVAGAVILFALLSVAVDRAVTRGMVLGNASPSVPRGLYVRAMPETATYVTFCLGTRHTPLPFSPRFCAPGAPAARQIIKRIAERRADGTLIVEGDTPASLDSRILGPIAPEDIRGWWRPLFVIDREATPRMRIRDQVTGTLKHLSL